VFFRTSSIFGKNPITNVNSKTTIKSLLKSFEPEEIIVICDNTSMEQYKYFANNFPTVYKTNRGNAGSFRLCVELCKVHYAEIYYFVEDDHLHLPNQKEWLLSGLKIFDFISLYDHPDKYYLNMYKDLKRSIHITDQGYFISAPSTVMTFACLSSTLNKTRNILLEEDFTSSSLKTPLDHYLFLKLLKEGYSLGNPIPGRSTHCEKDLLSPYIDWERYVKILGY
tara:strand:+ start:2174 stop:2845 length:672 start_codon:yes stop_codon:yes gene_type:complete